MADPLLVLFGQRIRRERERRGWSQRDLAEKAQSKGPSICEYEQARCEPRLLAALRIAGALEIPLGDLVTNPDCTTCYGRPPDGFACKACGRGGETP